MLRTFRKEKNVSMQSLERARIKTFKDERRTLDDPTTTATTTTLPQEISVVAKFTYLYSAKKMCIKSLHRLQRLQN